MRKIKILRIIARLNIGGPAIHTILLTEGLVKTKFETLLVCGSIGKEEGDMSYYALEKNVHPYVIPELKRELNFLSDIAAFKKFYHLIKKEQPDIIHTHTAKAGALGRLAGLLYQFLNPNKKIKLIHTFHGHIFEGYFSKIKTKLFIFIERFLAFFTAQLITVSDSVRQELINLRIAKANKIEVIPLGLELDKFLNIPPRDNHALNIGIVGRLVPIKNHRLFLDAAKLLTTDYGLRTTDYGFFIIGDGELRKELEEYSYQLGINNYVHFLGWQKDLVKVYADLDIVALTSLNEGTPVSLIEAMASGRTVVATDIGGIRDLLGAEINAGVELNAGFKVLERGIIVNSGDSFSFARALILALENYNLRQDLAACARNFVRLNFRKERLIEDIEALYYQILRDKRKLYLY